MEKSADAFRTISEVAEALDTPAHVLRFWESRFPQVKPVKRAGGRRYYRPADVALLGGIKKLLHDDGLTIRGVQKMLKEHGVRHVSAFAGALAESGAETAEPAPAAPPLREAGKDAEALSGEEAAPSAVSALAPAAPPAPPRAADAPPPVPPRREVAEDEEEGEELSDADEAPMQEDAPLLPFEKVVQIVRTTPSRPGGAAPAEPGPLFAAAEEEAAAGAPSDPGAAARLRAVDPAALAGKEADLAAIYRRLRRLRDRLASGAPTPRP